MGDIVNNDIYNNDIYNNDIYNIVYCFIFCILILFITSHMVSSNLENVVSQETQESNKNERLVSWIIMSVSLVFIITIIILVPLQNKIPKESISTIYKVFTIFLGLLSLTISLLACDHFGRNNKSNLIFFIIILFVFILLLNLRI